MTVQTQLCFLLFGTCLVSFLLLLECKKLEGYAFPVFSTKECPGNQADWNNRSSAINCTESNGYMCLPNENFTDLLELCYIYPRILVQKDLCLYLVKRFSRVNSYNCRKFTHGCPELSYFSSETYIHPSCMEIENGCFSAEPSCKRQPLPSENSIDDTTLAIILGVSIPACLLCILAFCVIIRKSLRRKVRRGGDKEMDVYMHMNDMENRIESLPFLRYERRETLKNYKKSRPEMAIFDQWKQDDSFFISTKACKEVENIIKTKNLVIVAGHSGSGKSAIIQHIALKYRKQGWTVKRVKEVKDIVEEYASSRFQKNKTICVFNDPLGKESFDEILNNSWQKYREELELYLKTAKLVMSCRSHIICDARLKRYLLTQSNVVNIDNNKYKLSVQEKRQILTKYTSDMNLSDEDCSKIVEVEMYFPLLCKLYSSKEEYKPNGIGFFTEPVAVLKEEIEWFRKEDQGKYCALALLVLFNDDLCVRNLFKNKETENKFKHTLKLCGLPKKTSPSNIGENFNSLENLFVKKVGDSYHFYHDFVMEVTTHVFGTDYPAEIIKYADIGFLRSKVKLGYRETHDDPFTIYLSDRYTEKLGERLFTELFGERLLDVVLNPCLRNEKVIEFLKRKLEVHPKSLQMLLKTKKLSVNQQELDMTSKSLRMSKLDFLESGNEVSPIVAMAIFCHTQLLIYCLTALPQKQINLNRWLLIPAICCNGSIELFYVYKHHAEEYLKKTWNGLCPIHVVSVFHNYKLLNELIKVGVKVNEKTDDYGGWTPLMLAAGNDTQEHGDYNHGEPGAKRRDKTVQLLLSNGADINLCMEDGSSPLYIACQNGHDSTVQLLLSKGADINLSMKDGASPLYIACQNGLDSTAQLLLSNGADINLFMKDGASPLYIACQNGHNSMVLSFLSNVRDINLGMEDGSSPLYIACQNGHDITVQLLLRYEADINLRKKDGKSPLYIACQNGHDRLVQILLEYKADINLPKKDGESPLHIACQNGHDSTAQLLLSNGADINLCMGDGASPLFVACRNGNDTTVQLLLRNGADINLGLKHGVSPLYVAFERRRYGTVNILIENGADTSLFCGWEVNPALIDCFEKHDKHDSTVEFLLQKDNIQNNMYDPDSYFSLFVSCQLERVTRLIFYK